MPRGPARRLVLWIEYDGTGFHGWQSQPGQRTVQDELEAALARMCGEPVRVIGSGRTDAGVHALGQVAHFDTASDISPGHVRLGLNTMLAGDVTVADCREADPAFHAQHDALRKTYRYRILNRRAPSALRRHLTWHLRARLDVAAMRAAAGRLVGEHDFAAFARERGRPADAVRRLERLEVRAEGDEVIIEATASGFLRHMVRNLAGTLAEVGRGERDPASMDALLASGERTRAGPTAPAAGLTLVSVDYGDKLPPPDPGAHPPPAAPA